MSYQLESTWSMVDSAAKANMQTVNENITIPFTYDGNRPKRVEIEQGLTDAGLELPTGNNQYLMANGINVWLVAFDAANDRYVLEKLTIAK